MKIYESNLSFKSLSDLGQVKGIILHHAESTNCTIYNIHEWHLNNGWSGCGYHFFIRKDGSIYRGRPENKLGAHTSNHNTGNLGICFEGAFNKETMTNEQLKSGQELIIYLCDKYGLSKSSVKRHKDYNTTDCPGSNFPYEKLLNSTTNVVNDNWYEKVFNESKAQGFSKPPIVRKGAKGNITKLIQERLIYKGVKLPIYGCDSAYGSETEDGVKEFQRLKGLSVDGVVGDNTWNALK